MFKPQTIHIPGGWSVTVAQDGNGDVILITTAKYGDGIRATLTADQADALASALVGAANQARTN
jgi:hypothetical protein